jgi:hypothetical protein
MIVLYMVASARIIGKVFGTLKRIERLGRKRKCALK